MSSSRAKGLNSVKINEIININNNNNNEWIKYGRFIIWSVEKELDHHYSNVILKFSIPPPPLPIVLFRCCWHTIHKPDVLYSKPPYLWILRCRDREVRTDLVRQKETIWPRVQWLGLCLSTAATSVCAPKPFDLRINLASEMACSAQNTVLEMDKIQKLTNIVLTLKSSEIISLYNINWLFFITEPECVYCAVRTGYLYIIQVMCFVWIWEQTAIISLYSINWLVCITEKECLLRGRDWIFIYNSGYVFCVDLRTNSDYFPIQH